MVWGFIWRFVFYGLVLASVSTFLVGFGMGLAGSISEAVHSTGRVVQGLALVLAALIAYGNTKDAQKA